MFIQFKHKLISIPFCNGSSEPGKAIGYTIFDISKNWFRGMDERDEAFGQNRSGSENSLVNVDLTDDEYHVVQSLI